jgi:hypothetical protein
MEQEKIASRLILADGTTFNIGTVGAVENVAIKLSAPTSEDWASYKVIVQDITDGANNGEYQLNALGEAKFFIPMGHTYSVTLPTIGDYTMPLIITLTAQLASRIITHEYSMSEVQYEQINISALVVNGDVSMLNGKLVVAKAESGNVYAEEFANGKITMRIPYGEKCKLTLPDVEGWWRDGLNIQFTTGLPSRDILIHYSEIPIGFFGIDDDGNRYTIEQIEAMVDNGEDTSIIHYIGYNDATLAIADRGDGTIGCGFSFEIPFVNASYAYTSQNILFDTNRFPYDFNNKKSTYTTSLLIQMGEEEGVSTPSATYCRLQSIEYGGVTRKGNLIAPYLLKCIILNYTQLERIGQLLNKVIPNVKTGIWGTCEQGPSADALIVASNGSIVNQNQYKTSKANILVCYDL